MNWELIAKLGISGIVGLVAIEKSFSFARWVIMRRNGQPAQEIKGTIKIDNDQWTAMEVHHAGQKSIARDVETIRDKVTT